MKRYSIMIYLLLIIFKMNFSKRSCLSANGAT